MPPLRVVGCRGEEVEDGDRPPQLPREANRKVVKLLERRRAGALSPHPPSCDVELVLDLGYEITRNGHGAWICRVTPGADAPLTRR
jgi:hypothetical protein